MKMASKATTKPLSDGIASNFDMDAAGDDADTAGNKSQKRLSVERIYQKKTQLEHILLRPDTYIGSVEPLTQNMWVYEEDVGMVYKEITFVPGLYKIFDEILVNAADNKQRDPKMDCIKIDIDPENNKVSIWNNGKGIPVVQHKVEKMFVPSLIFGHLLTSSNYNDDEKKVTGGRNGYGAKLCNIFSTKFIVETASKESGKHFKQTWCDNMNKTAEAKITSSSEDFTRVTFYPDLAKFKMSSLDKDIVALMSRRAYDVAGSTRGVKVFLNGKRLPVKNFKEYAEQYLKGREDDQGNPLKLVYELANDRWEVAVTQSEKGFQQVSFVNSIATTKGGRHVDYVTDQIVSKIVEVVKKRNKGGVQIKPFQVKNHMWVFVNCLIENPTFDSQTKENMTLQAKSFGSKCQFNDKFLNQVVKSGIVENVMTWMKFKAATQLNKKCHATKHSKLSGVPKLEDANDAGTKNSLDCTLILTEGDSAKTLAVSGLAVIGRDKYGVFPLRGKMLNVREATHKQILENAEINNIIKIMGLQYKKKYETVDDLKTLRYGRLMIMTDQDQDGSHIKGLLINFIHHNWPGLLRLPFLEEFITPIVKATKGKEELSFFSLPEFEEWKKQTSNWNSWKIKYYKGLGTSTSKEAKEYFADMLRHRILFKYDGPEDDGAIQLAFSKKMIEQRKEWLTKGMQDRKERRELGLPELYLYGKGTKAVTYQEFVNKELILFSNMDNERSIPSLVDGLKPGQRKVIFTCLKKHAEKEIKVAQLAGSVGQHSAYHHGEASLMGTIINLAQNFVGSNNINLLLPIGQFGTRLQGGKDAASPRYIFTMLSPVAKHLFNSYDEPLLRHLYDDNLKIEPEYYVPIIPLVLVNGAEGIGTGWSTKIPNYNPRDVVENLRRMLKGEDPVPMQPWFKNFIGHIEKVDNTRYVVSGELAKLDGNKIEITELPIRTWTQVYKETTLESMLHGTEKIPPMIQDYREYHTDTTVRFVVSMAEDKFMRAEEQGFHKVFKLQSLLSTSSMVLFDHNGVLRRYETPEEILKEFFSVRLDFYTKRKEYILGMLEAEASKLSNQAHFILEKIEGKILIENRKIAAIVKMLQERGYDPDPIKTWKKNLSKFQAEDGTSDSETDDKDAAAQDYYYLLKMDFLSSTMEKKDELLKKRDDKLKELQDLKKKSPPQLWEDDLDEFLKELDKVEQREKDDELSSKPSKAASKGGLPFSKARSKKPARDETKPSPAGIRIEPQIDPEYRRKFDKPSGTAGEGKKRRQKKEAGDEDGASVASDKPAAKRKKGMKQSTLDFKPKQSGGSPTKGKKKRKSWSDSESDDKSISDVPDIEFVAVEQREHTPRRAAAARIKYNFDSDEDELDEGTFIPPTDTIPQETEQRTVDSDSESEARPVNDRHEPESNVNGDSVQSDSNTDESAEDVSNTKNAPAVKSSSASGTPPPNASLFDTLLARAPDSSKNNQPEPKEKQNSSDQEMDSNFEHLASQSKKQKDTTSKPAPKKRQKKKASSSSDDSFDEFIPKPKKTSTAKRGGGGPGRKKKAAAKGSDSEEESGTPPTKMVKEQSASSRTARSRAPVKYNFGDDSSDEDY